MWGIWKENRISLELPTPFPVRADIPIRVEVFLPFLSFSRFPCRLFSLRDEIPFFSLIRLPYSGAMDLLPVLSLRE
jgi:hypothetical protein